MSPWFLIFFFLFFMLNSVVFYFLGRYAGRESEVVKEAVSIAKKSKIEPLPSGAIDYAGPEELEKTEDDDLIEKQWMSNAKKGGLL